MIIIIYVLSNKAMAKARLIFFGLKGGQNVIYLPLDWLLVKPSIKIQYKVDHTHHVTVYNVNNCYIG